MKHVHTPTLQPYSNYSPTLPTTPLHPVIATKRQHSARTNQYSAFPTRLYVVRSAISEHAPHCLNYGGYPYASHILWTCNPFHPSPLLISSSQPLFPYLLTRSG
ncbi:hypothetical protein ISCGN_002023 [Ixodes scapularis]